MALFLTLIFVLINRERTCLCNAVAVWFYRPEGSGQVRYAESSMRNGFGLKYLHMFFNLPFLQLQVGQPSCLCFSSSFLLTFISPPSVASACRFQSELGEILCEWLFPCTIQSWERCECACVCACVRACVQWFSCNTQKCQYQCPGLCVQLFPSIT